MADNGRRPGETLDGMAKFPGTEGSAARSPEGLDVDLLTSIDATLKGILTNVNGMSQSAARGSMPGNKRDANKWSTGRGFKTGRGSSSLGGFDGILDKFTDGLEASLLESLGASEFKSKIQAGLSQVANDIGVEIGDIPNALGKELGSQLANTGIGKSVTGALKNLANRAMSSIADAYKSGQSASSYGDAIKKAWKSSSSSSFSNSDKDKSASSPNVQDIKDKVDQANDIVDMVKNIKGKKGGNVVKFPTGGATVSGNVGSQVAANASTSAGATSLTSGAGGAAGALKGVAAVASKAIPIIAAIVVVLMEMDKLLERLQFTVAGVTKLMDAAESAMNRSYKTQQKNSELAQERLKADTQSLVEAPFKILENAAQNLYDAWDNQIRIISASQGYYKEDVQSLMAVYAERLRDEGLTKVVSGANIVENLSKVLESGLSGQVAEEFAYLATKLNAAIPTQDFFSYASTYASVAANAIKNGQSQAEAIAYANAEMEAFASNVLYAGRQLSGGFSTGLKDAQQLFDYSVQIANASKTGDPSNISGVLTSVSAIAGAIAPDLASGIVDAVVKAATGGNSSEIVALRSLAGINASNTEFLRTLAENPQQVFTGLFTNLANMQNMSNDNFMEVAEGLSSVFGVSMDAFARVDFNYLANAISSMNVNNASLNENMELLASGQTTATAEQLKMQQINEYMMEEGLAYVLDNEVARQIQQHMWDEQLAREMMESTYAVELRGSALGFLESIKYGLQALGDFLNPFAAVKEVANLVYSAQEASGMEKDIKQLLELGKVGQGKPSQLYNLTTSNRSLGLTQTLVDLMGGYSEYDDAAMRRKDWTRTAEYMQGIFTPGIASYSGAWNERWRNEKVTGGVVPNSGVSSKYTWANVSKSTAAMLLNSAVSSGLVTTASSTSDSLASAVANKSTANFEKFLGTMESAITNNKSYEEWAATATANGIKDLNAAIAEYGTTEEALRGKFGQHEAQKASQYNADRQKKEDEFWAHGIMFYTNQQENWLKHQTLLTDNQTLMIAELTTANAKLAEIHNKEKEFLTAWTSYYINNEAYSKNTLSAYQAGDILKAEKAASGDAVLALAEALTANTIGITEGLKDPTVQTNVLLAKILLVAESIMQQNNKTGGLTLPDSLAALATGMIGESI